MNFQRRLQHVPSFDDLWPLMMELEEKHILPIGPLDEFRAEHFPEIAERTALTLQLTVIQIYREIAIRAMEAKTGEHYGPPSVS